LIKACTVLTVALWTRYLTLILMHGFGAWR